VKHWDNILAAYSSTDIPFSDWQFTVEQDLGLAVSEHDTAGIARLTRELAAASQQMLINRQAYFLMLFSQFEAAVNDAASHIIQKIRALEAGQTRRYCDVLSARLDNDVRKLSFLERVSLAVDKGSIEFRDVKLYYIHRNTIAHGGMLEDTIDVEGVARRLFDIAALFQESP
jgi:hypothetical protein